MSKGEKTMKFKDPGSACKEMLLIEAPSWEHHSTVSELVESLMAWQLLNHIIYHDHYGTDVIVWIVKKVQVRFPLQYVISFHRYTFWLLQNI